LIGQRIHGHPLLLAETFVDTVRFTGACYRAANWQVLGHTRGFSRHNGCYTAHGQPKQVLVYPLHRCARALLCAPQLPPAWSAPMQRVSLTTAQMEDLHRRLGELPDCRRPRGQRHRLATVLTIAIAAVLAGSRGYTAIAEWAARLTQKQLKRLRARYNRRTGRFEPPSEPTIRRILQNADVASIDASSSDWLLGLTDGNDAVAVDGKTLRGAVRGDGTKVHLLSAFLHGQGITAAQREITELKSAKQRSETVFAVTSLTAEQADPHQFLQLNRGQWAIENRSHYVRDMAFDEDRSRIRVGNGPAMMACLRNFAIALARLHGFTNIASALRAFAHQPRRALAAVGV
jgi:predicted transposase YbfD/YdcC